MKNPLPARPITAIRMLWLIAAIFASLEADTQGFLRVHQARIVNEQKQPILLRGIGLGGWMLQEGYMLRVRGIGQQQHSIRRHLEQLAGKERTNQFYEAWLNNHTTRRDIEALKQWGFNSVRLPMHYNLYTLPIEQEPVPGRDTWLDKGFRLTDSLLSWCREYGLYLILDLHAAPGGQGRDLNICDADTTKPFLWTSKENQRKTVALWRKLAGRYKDEPWIGAYDILNEPNWGFADPAGDPNGLKETGNEPLRKLMMDITAAIRSVDQRHIIIIEGNGWGNNYNGIFPPWDNNMVISFHKYWNHNNVRSIQRFLDYRRQYGLPIWLGESGENSNVWFTEAISLMEDNEIGWCWWPLKKMGGNNPLQVPANDNYQKILDYWSNKGPKPTGDVAFNGMMELASSTHFTKNNVRQDVLDAMFRQVGDRSALPFRPGQSGLGVPVLAAGYDLGPIGVAYYDTDSADYHISNGETGGNRGHAYRNDGVDIAEDDHGPYVTQTVQGEWLQYTLQLPEAGTYRVELQVSPGQKASKLALQVPGDSVSIDIAPQQPNHPVWRNLSAPVLRVPAGHVRLRVVVVEGGFGLRWLRLVQIAS